jgi:hypothetical protein
MEVQPRSNRDARLTTWLIGAIRVGCLYTDVMDDGLRGKGMRIMSQSGIVLETLARLRQLERGAERVEAKARFSLQRKKRLAPLSEEQTRQYHRDGYLFCIAISGHSRDLTPMVEMSSQAPGRRRRYTEISGNHEALMNRT